MPILDHKGRPIQPSTKHLQGELATREIVEAIATAAELMPHPSHVLKTTGKTIAAFKKTLLQPDVKAASLNFHDGIRALTWDLSQSVAEGERSKWYAAHLKKHLRIQDICSDAVFAREYGYTVFEVMWAEIEGRQVPVDLVAKPREWFKFDLGGRLRMITRNEPKGIPVDEKWPRKFICVRHDASYENPYGIGLIEVVYWLVQGLNSNFEWLLQFLEDDGRDHWIGYVPADASQEYIDKVKTALSVLRRRSVAVLFEGVRAEQRENKGRKSSSDVFIAFDQYAVTKINKLWLGTDLSMQLNDVGARATSETGADIRGEALSSGKALAEQVFNTLIRWTAELNSLPGSDDEEINFVLSKTAETTKDQAEIDKTYSEATGRKLSDQLLARRGYEPGDFTEATEEGGNNEPVTVFQSGYGGLVDAVEGLKKKY